MKRLSKIRYCAIFFVGLIPLSTSASNINVSVEILAPSCTINNGDIIEVDFGDELLSTRLDGINYSKDITANFQCNSATPEEIYLKIEGDEWVKDGHFLKTSKVDLAIQFRVNSTHQPINKRITIDPSKPFTLQVAPIFIGEKRLSAGSFTATGTLAIYYQ
jgi:type 1 fimbria pilin